MPKSPLTYLTEALSMDDILNNIPSAIKGSNLLYRSFYKSYSKLRDFGMTTVVKDRTPVDTPIEIHNMFDKYFKAKFGVEPRKNSLFCSKSLKVARHYADNVDDVYIIIPLGSEVKYAYSKKILDFFHAMIDITFDELCEQWDVIPSISVDKALNDITKTKDKKLYNKVLPDIEKVVEKMVDSYKMTTDLSSVPMTGEVMVLCEDFYYINLMEIDEDDVKTYGDLLQ